MEVEYLRYHFKRKFGVELEVGNSVPQDKIRSVILKNSSREVVQSGWAQSVKNKYWHVKTDSTCGPLGKGKDVGFEVASYVASGYEDVLEIGLVAEKLAENQVTVNKNCGLHIHVNCVDFAIKQMGILVARWCKLEQLIKQMVPIRRKRNKYARWLSSAKKKNYNPTYPYDPLTFLDCIRPTNFNIHENNQKKVALNLINYIVGTGHYTSGSYGFSENKETIEFRFPEGTLNSVDIKNWIRFFICFVEASKNAKMPSAVEYLDTLDDLFNYLGLEGDGKFIILSKALYELKIWICERIISHGLKKYVKMAKDKLKICLPNDR